VSTFTALMLLLAAASELGLYGEKTPVFPLTVLHIIQRLRVTIIKELLSVDASA